MFKGALLFFIFFHFVFIYFCIGKSINAYIGAFLVFFCLDILFLYLFVISIICNMSDSSQTLQIDSFC